MHQHCAAQLCTTATVVTLSYNCSRCSSSHLNIQSCNAGVCAGCLSNKHRKHTLDTVCRIVGVTCMAAASKRQRKEDDRREHRQSAHLVGVVIGGGAPHRAAAHSHSTCVHICSIGCCAALTVGNRSVMQSTRLHHPGAHP